MTFRRVRSGTYWRYYLDGKRPPSVTTLIGAGVPKPALVNWSAGVAAEFAVDNVDVIGRLERAAAIEMVKGAANRHRDSAALRGTDVHRIADRLAAGESVDVPDEHAGLIDGYLRFVEDFQVEPLAVEGAIASRRWWYAGTFDLLARLRGDLVAMVDIKTGRRIYREACLQIAAYRHAEITLDADENEIPMPETAAGFALLLTGDGGYELVPVESGADTFAVFLHACHVAGFARRDEDELLGAPVEIGQPA